MRTEPAIVIQAGEAVGPTRLRVLTASSSKLPVVVVEQRDDGPGYHVFSVATLQAGLTDHLATDGLADALGLADRDPVPPVSLSGVSDAEVGTPVVENGRVLGVRAPDAIELAELTESDLTARPRPKAAAADEQAEGDDDGDPEAAESSGRRSLWKRITGH